jgi:tetratricopeptide (TPR) repeat protein
MRVPGLLLSLLPLLSFTAAADPPNEKAAKYYEALLRRPAPGVVFDRFYNAWLDTGTLEDLEKYLRAAADAPDAGAGPRLVLAFYYAKQSDHAKAAAEFGKALEKSPGSAEAWHQKALAESRLLDLTAALASLERGLAANPGKELSLELRQLQGRLLARDGRTAEALEVWQELLASAPDDEALQEDVIDLQAAEGLTKEALATAQALLERTQDPYRKVQRRLRTGDLLARMGQRDAAVAAYSTALDDTGADSWLEKEILAQLEQVFRRDDAVDAFKIHLHALAEKYPQRLALARREARLLGETGDADGAMAAFRRILERAPGDRTMRESYIDLLSQNKRHAEAVAQLEELMKQHQADAELPARLAELQYAAGNASGAQAAAELFLTKSDQSEAAHLRAAALLERCAGAAPGLAMYQRTAEKFSASEGAQDALAVALHRAGKKEEAAAAWRRLAAGADKARLTNVARSAASRDETALAWELLSARAAEFQDDAVFLTQLCDTASRAEKYAEALPFARRAVVLAKDAVSLEPALVLAVRFAEKAKQQEVLATELASASSPQELALLAELHEKAGRKKEAEAALQKITASAELASAMQVRLHSSRGEQDEAAQAMLKLVEAPGGQKPAHVQRLVDLLTRAGKFEEALKWVQTWKRVSPGATQPWLRESALQVAAGRSAEALQTLRQAAAQYDTDTEVKLALAAAFRTDGRYGDALRLYTALYEDAQELSEKVKLAGDLAQTAQQAGQTAELVESFDGRRRSNRTSLAPLLSLAEIYRVMENYESRRTTLLEAARLAPENRDIRMEIARSAEREGDWERAVQALRDLADGDPTGRTHLQLASALYEAGREEESRQVIARLVAEGKLDERGAEGVAASMMAAQEYEACVAFLVPLLEKYPQDYRLAWLHAAALLEIDDAGSAAALVRLMGMKQDLPSAAPVTGAAASAAAAQASAIRAARPGYRDPVSDAAPELDKFNFLQGYMQSAARGNRAGYRSSSSFGQYPGWGRGYSASRSIVMPATLDMLRGMTLGAMGRLWPRASEEERAALLAAVEAAGFREPDVMLEMAAGMAGSNSAGDLRARFPQSRLLLLNAAANIARGIPGDAAVAAEIYGKIKDSHPALARLVVLSLMASNHDEHIALLSQEVDAMLAEAERTNTIPPVLNFVTALQRGTRYNSRNVSPALAPVCDRLCEWLKARESQLEPPLRSALQQTMKTRYMEKGDIAALVKELDAQAAGERESQQKAAMAPASQFRRVSPATHYNGNGDKYLPPLEPLTTRSVFGGFFDTTGGQNSQFQAGFLRWPPEKVIPLLPQVKSPLLRLHLAQTTKDEKLVGEAMAALMAEERPGRAELLAVAAWLNVQQRWDEAEAWLRRHFQPVAPYEEQLLDAMTLTLATRVLKSPESKDAKFAPLLQTAREAVVRLQPSAALVENGRKELPEVMKLLGMEMEAAAFKQLAERRAQKAQQITARTQSSRPQQQQQPRLEKLVEAGRKDEAVKLLAKEYKAFAQAMMAGAQYNSSNFEGGGIKQRVEKMGLTEPLLAALDPGTSVDVTAVVAWGLVQEAFNGPAQAVEHFRKALDRRPRNEGIFTAWFRASFAAAPQDLGKLMAQTDPAMLDSVNGFINNYEPEVLRSMEVRVAMLESLEQWLKSMNAATLGGTKLSWLWSKASQWRHPYGGEDYKKYGTLSGQEPEARGVTEQDHALRKRWRGVTERLLLLLAKNGSIAPNAFSTYAGIRMGFEPETAPEELDRLALETLEAMLANRQAVRRNNQHFFSYSGHKDIKWTGILPGEWLLRRALERNTATTLNESVIPRLREAGLPGAEELATAVKLHTCTDAEFPALARKLAEQGRAGEEPHATLRLAAAVMRRRALDADLASLILEPLPAAWERNSQGNLSYAVTDYAVALKQRHGFKAQAEFLRKVSETALGPADRRAELIKSEYKPNSWGGDGFNTRVHYWKEWIENACREPEIALALTLELDREFLVHCADPREAIGSDRPYPPMSQPGNFSRPADEFMQGIRGSAALADLEDFDLPIVPSQYDAYNLPAGIFSAMRGGDRKKVREAFAAEPKTFGSQFMVAVVEDVSGDALLTLLGERRDDLEKLPVARQRRILAHYQAAVAKQKFGRETEVMTKGAAWIDGLAGRAAADGLEKFLKAEMASTLFEVDVVYGREVARILTQLLKREPEQALTFFLKARRQVAEDQKAGTEYKSENRSFGGNDPMRLSPSRLGAALTAAVTEVQGAMKAGDPLTIRQVAAVAQMMAVRDGVAVEGNRTINEHLGWLVMKAAANSEKDNACRLPLLLDRLGPLLKPEWMPAAYGALEHAMWHSEVRKRPDDHEWLRPQWSGGKHRELALTCYLGAKVAAYIEHKPAQAVASFPAAIPEEQQWAVELLKSKSVPPAQLAALAGSLLKEWYEAAPALRYACAHALADAWKAGQPVPEELADHVVESLTLMGTNHVMPDDAALRDAAKAVCEGWLHIFPDPNNARAPLYGFTGTSYEDRLLSRRMMYLALACGHTADGLEMANRMKQNLWGLTPAWLGMLVFFHQPEAAQSLLNVRAPAYYNRDKDGRNIGWDYKAGVHDALLELLAKYENPFERYRAEVILRGLPDIQSEGIGGPLKGKVPDRDGRLLALAKAWPGDDVIKLPDGPRLLARLLEVPGAPAALEPVLERLSEEKKLLKLLPRQNSNDSEPVSGRIAAAIIAQRVRAGDFAPLQAYCREALKQKQNNYLDYYAADAAGRVLRAVFAELPPLWPKLDETKRREFARLGRDVFAEEQVRNCLGNVADNAAPELYMQLWWLALTLGDSDTEDFNKRIATPVKGSGDYLLHTLQHAGDLGPWLSKLPEPWTADAPDRAQQRSAWMLRWIIGGAELPGHYNGGTEWFHRVIKAGWLRREDVLSQAAELIAKRPRISATVQELVVLALEAKDEAALAVALAAARAKLPDACDGAPYFRMWEKLRDADRFQEAQQVLEVFTPDVLAKHKLHKDIKSGLPVKKMEVALVEAGVTGGMKAFGKLANVQFTNGPQDPPTWLAAAWAGHNLAHRAAAAGQTEEAIRRHALSAMFKRAAERQKWAVETVNYPENSKPAGELLKAAGRDPKEFETMLTADGRAKILEAAGPSWKLLPPDVLRLLTEPPAQ